MADISYVCLYFSYLDMLSPFNDAEKGRLMTAMINFAANGEIPEFEGNERFIWAALQSQIERDKAAYQKKCEKLKANGAKGGRPKNQKVTEETKETKRLFSKPKEAKEKENEKENEKEKDNYTYIVDYLNEKAGTKYKSSSKKTQTCIHARLAEGFTIDDFKTVIDKKCADWMNTEWEKYLRPETLFGTKFESYLNGKGGNNGADKRLDDTITDKVGVWF